MLVEFMSKESYHKFLVRFWKLLGWQFSSGGTIGETQKIAYTWAVKWTTFHENLSSLFFIFQPCSWKKQKRKSTLILPNLVESCKVMQNLAESWGILSNLAYYFTILKNLAEICKLLWNIADSCRILQNLLETYWILQKFV